jgi:hypothetical protein
MEKILKLLFIPISVAAAITAGMIGRKVFEFAWGRVDDAEAPHPKQREIGWAKLLIALVIEGAIFRAVRGTMDHAARSGFNRVTGTWPGEQRPEPK